MCIFIPKSFDKAGFRRELGSKVYDGKCYCLHTSDAVRMFVWGNRRMVFWLTGNPPIHNKNPNVTLCPIHHWAAEKPVSCWSAPPQPHQTHRPDKNPHPPISFRSSRSPCVMVSSEAMSPHELATLLDLVKAKRSAPASQGGVGAVSGDPGRCACTCARAHATHSGLELWRMCPGASVRICVACVGVGVLAWRLRST